MSDPQRLRFSGRTDRVSTLEQELLVALEPGAETKKALYGRVARQVGLAATVTGVAAAKSATAATTQVLGAAPAAGAAEAGALGGGLLAKLSATGMTKVGLALAALIPAAGGALYLSQSNPEPEPLVKSAPVVVSENREAEATVVSEDSPATEPAPSLDPAEPSRTEPPKAAAVARPPEPESALAAENRLLQQARAATRSGRVGEARRDLQELDQRFPRGALRQERELLRIETELAGGRREQAAALAERFLDAYPESPYAAHVQTLLAR